MTDITTARTDGSAQSSTMPADALAAADDLVAAARAKSSAGNKKVRKEIRRLGRRLDAARSMEAKRLRQSARAQREVDKRERQAADAAAKVRLVVGRINDAARTAAERVDSDDADRARVAVPRSKRDLAAAAVAPKVPPVKPTAQRSARGAADRSQKPTA